MSRRPWLLDCSRRRRIPAALPEGRSGPRRTAAPWRGPPRGPGLSLRFARGAPRVPSAWCPIVPPRTPMSGRVAAFPELGGGQAGRRHLDHLELEQVVMAGGAHGRSARAPSRHAPRRTACRFAGEVVRPPVLRSAAEFVLPTSASVYRFGAEAGSCRRPAPSPVTCCRTRLSTGASPPKPAGPAGSSSRREGRTDVAGLQASAPPMVVASNVQWWWCRMVAVLPRRLPGGPPLVLYCGGFGRACCRGLRRWIPPRCPWRQPVA